MLVLLQRLLNGFVSTPTLSALPPERMEGSLGKRGDDTHCRPAPARMLLLLGVLLGSVLVPLSPSHISQGAILHPQAKVLKIGILLPLHGPLAHSTRVALNGAALAISQADSKHLLPGYHLVLEPRDVLNASGAVDPHQALQSLQAFINDPQVVGVVGPLTLPEALALLPVADRSGLALLSPSLTDPRLTKPTFGGIDNRALWRSLHPTGRSTFFRVVPTDEEQGLGMAGVVRKGLNKSRTDIIHDQTLLGRSETDTFLSAYTRLGGTVLHNIALPGKPGVGLNLDLSKGQADALFLTGGRLIGNKALSQLLKHYKHVTILADSGPLADPRLNQVLGSLANGTLAFSPIPSVAGKLNTREDQFVQAYRRQYGTAPDPTLAAGAFQATNSLSLALQALVKGLRPGETLESEGIVGEPASSQVARSTRLRQHLIGQLLRSPIPGLFGDFRFDRNGDTTANAITCYTSNGKQFQFVTNIPVTAAPPASRAAARR